ncbi:MAG: hypothetical protein KAI17_24570, partial [Thiotrichaceae bacterium]|nr:hypothetical protein [Thiotrichaceae bacterium]
FKNYVLRGKDSDLTKLLSNVQIANKILDQYLTLPGVSQTIDEEIKTIRGTVNNYKNAAESINAMKDSVENIAEIDSFVKINDGPALEAIKRLGEGNFGIDPSYWFKTMSVKINLLKQFEDKLAKELAVKSTVLKSSATFNLITIAIVSLVGLFISIGLSTLISKNLRQQIGGEPSDIEAIANQIAEGSLEVKRQNGQSSGVYAAIMSMQNKLSTVISEIQTLVDAARKGDLSNRIELENKTGFYKSLTEGVNDVVESSDSIINDTVRVFSSLATGDLNQTITTSYQGSFNQLKEDANATVAKLKQVIEGDIQALVNAALKGDLTNRIDLSDKEGFFSDMSMGINQLVDSVNNIFNDASTAMDSMAHGDLTKPIQNNYLGQFDTLKNNINETMHNLESTITTLRESSDVV